MYSDQKYSTPMLYARRDNGAKARHLTSTFDVVRKEIVKRNFPKAEAAWDAADYAMYLDPTNRGSIKWGKGTI